MAQAQGKAAKQAASRHSILAAAARLFAQRGFGGTSLQHVADELGISRPALYYYFRSKDDILASLVQEITVAAGERARAARDSGPDPVAALRLAVGSHVGWLLGHPLEFRVLDSSERDLPAEVRAVHDHAKREVLDDFTAIIARGIESGDFRPVEAQVAAFTIIGMCSWTAWWFRPDGRLPAERVADAIADMAVASIRREGGSGTGRALTLAEVTRRLGDDVALLERLAGQAA